RGTRPARACSSVDLPTPLGPTTPIRSPGATTRSMPSRTVSGPRVTVRSLARRGAAAGTGTPGTKRVGRRQRAPSMPASLAARRTDRTAGSPTSVPLALDGLAVALAQDAVAAVVGQVVPRPIDE